MTLRPTPQFLVFLAVALALALADLWVRSGYLVAFAIGMIIYLGWNLFAALRAARRTRLQIVRRLPPGQVRRGQSVRIDLDHSGSSIPKGYRFWVRDRPPRELVPESRGQSETGSWYQARAAARGEVRFHGLRAGLEDRGGMWRQRHEVPASESRFVEESEEAERFRHRLGKPSRADRGLPSGIRTAFREDPDSSISPYQPGDPARDIDWKAYARQQKLLVRKWDLNPAVEVTIVVDASPSMRRGPGETALERATELALEMAYAALKASHRVKVVAVAEDRLVLRWGPATNRRLYPELERDLQAVAVDALRGRTRPLAEPVHRAIRGPRGSWHERTIMVYSDLDSIGDDTFGLLADVAQRGVEMVVIPTGPAGPGSMERLDGLVERGAESFWNPAT